MESRGSYLAAKSFSDEDDHGVMVCRGWTLSLNTVSFTWKDSDGNVVEATPDEVLVAGFILFNFYHSSKTLFDYLGN